MSVALPTVSDGASSSTEPHATQTLATNATACAASNSGSSNDTTVDMLSQLDAETLGLLVTYVDTRWHVEGLTQTPLAPLSVVALGCLNRSILDKLRLVRPAIRMGTYGQARSGDLLFRPGPFQRAHQAFGALARAGNLGLVFARQAAGDPGTDGVDLGHIGQIDPGDRTVQCTQILIDRADGGARDWAAIRRGDEAAAPPAALLCTAPSLCSLCAWTRA